MDYRRIIDELKKFRTFMVSRQRAAHMERMEEDAITFSKIHSVSVDKLLVSVCAHDLFRDVEPYKLMKIATLWGVKITAVEKHLPLLLHGKVAAEYVKRRFGLHDEEILDAIAYHTSGILTDSKIVKSMFILDSTESGRVFDGVDELRNMALVSIDKGYEAIIKNKLIYAITNDLLVLPETVETWNYMRGVRD
jgi:predicted HD superfamily hydrolase involved in NAD metabolism